MLDTGLGMGSLRLDSGLTAGEFRISARDLMVPVACLFHLQRLNGPNKGPLRHVLSLLERTYSL
jgi:hypothetical protein